MAENIPGTFDPDQFCTVSPALSCFTTGLSCTRIRVGAFGRANRPKAHLIKGKSMPNIDKHFTRWGALLIVIGMFVGLYMAGTQNFKIGSVHAHLALFGGVLLIVYGLVYRAGLAKNDMWATLHLWVSVIGAFAFPIGEYFAITAGQHLLAGVASLIVLLSGLLFLFNVARA
jgi:hypothetical protein